MDTPGICASLMEIHGVKRQELCLKPVSPKQRTSSTCSSWDVFGRSLDLVLGFPGGSDGKASACNAGDPGLIPGLGRSPGDGRDATVAKLVSLATTPRDHSIHKHTANW